MAPIRAIRCGTLFDATGAPPIRSAVILVAGGRITAVGPAASTPVPPEAEVLDWNEMHARYRLAELRIAEHGGHALHDYAEHHLDAVLAFLDIDLN